MISSFGFCRSSVCPHCRGIDEAPSVSRECILILINRDFKALRAFDGAGLNDGGTRAYSSSGLMNSVTRMRCSVSVVDRRYRVQIDPKSYLDMMTAPTASQRLPATPHSKLDIDTNDLIQEAGLSPCSAICLVVLPLRVYLSFDHRIRLVLYSVPNSQLFQM